MTSKILRQGKLPLSSTTFALAMAAVFACSPIAARADALGLDPVLTELDNLAAPILASDGTITHYGVTLYGVEDVGLAYESHGTTSNPNWSNGTDFMISNNSNTPRYIGAQGGLAGARLGVKGNIPTTVSDVNVVFRLEQGLNGLTGANQDGLKSLTQNFDKQSAQSLTQSANNDSSLAGQVFNRAAFGGVGHPVAGQLTFGRHTGLLADAVAANDPLGGSPAFSLLGFSSTAAGGGATEDARLDQSFRYSNKIGPVRFGAMYQLPNNTSKIGGDDAYQANLGIDYQDFTVDAVYSLKHDAVSSASLTSGDIGGNAAGNAGWKTITNGALSSFAGFNSTNTVSATISDNTAYALFGTYKPISSVKTFFGYELIDYSNASNASSLTQADLEKFGSYNLYIHSLNNFNQSKVLQYIWAGTTYKVTKDVTLAIGYYHVNQNNFANYSQTGSSVKVSAGSQVKNSAGQENVVGFDADYQLTKRLDVYAGASWSQVGGGMDFNVPYGTVGSHNTIDKQTGFTYNNDVTLMTGMKFAF